MTDDQVRELLKDITDFIAPLIPEEARFVLWIDPDVNAEPTTHPFKFWSGNVSDVQFHDLIFHRIHRQFEKLGPSAVAWWEKGPPTQ